MLEVADNDPFGSLTSEKASITVQVVEDHATHDGTACAECHAGQVDGYMQTAHRAAGIGCESCHGPGSAHVDAENGDIDVTDAELTKLREEMRLTLAEAKQTKCFECHDLDNSPDFQKPGAFDEYWEQVKHAGMD